MDSGLRIRVVAIVSVLLMGCGTSTIVSTPTAPSNATPTQPPREFPTSLPLTPTPVSSITPTPTPLPLVNGLSGIPEVDRIIVALRSGDVEVIRPLAELQREQCDRGGPILYACSRGYVEGISVQWGCHSTLIPLEAAVKSWNRRVLGVSFVRSGQPDADYFVIYEAAPSNFGSPFADLWIRAGKISAFGTGECNSGRTKRVKVIVG